MGSLVGLPDGSDALEDCVNLRLLEDLGRDVDNPGGITALR